MAMNGRTGVELSIDAEHDRSAGVNPVPRFIQYMGNTAIRSRGQTTRRDAPPDSGKRFGSGDVPLVDAMGGRPGLVGGRHG